MSTYTHRSRALEATTHARLRRTVSVAALVPLLSLAACSSDAPTPAASILTGSGSGVSTTTGSGSTDTATSTSTAPSTSTPTAPATTPLPGPTQVSPGLSFYDPQLGHTVKVNTLVRNRPWPAGHPIAAQSYELVAVNITVTAGGRYSAAVQPWMFSLQALPSVWTQTTTEFGSTLGPALKGAARGQTQTGWLFFKVNRGNGHPLKLWLHRPAYKVSTTGASFPAAIHGAQIAS